MYKPTTIEAPQSWESREGPSVPSRRREQAGGLVCLEEDMKDGIPETLTEKLEFLNNLDWRLSEANRVYADCREAILSPVQEQLDELVAEQQPGIDKLQARVEDITEQVKRDAVAQHKKDGTKETSTRMKLVRIQQSATRWDTKGLDVLAVEVPAILACRKEGTFYAKFGNPK